MASGTGQRLGHRAHGRATELGQRGQQGQGQVGSSEDISGDVSHRNTGLDSNLFCKHQRFKSEDGKHHTNVDRATPKSHFCYPLHTTRFLLLYCSLSLGHFAFNICNK